MKRLSFNTVCIAAFIVLFNSCQTPIDKIQGVYTADKPYLKKAMQAELTDDSPMAVAMMDKLIENAVVELKIEDDSLEGLFFLAGQTHLIKSKIELKNDSTD